MAAFFRHGLSKTTQRLTPKNVFPKCYATKAEKRKGLDRKPSPKLDSTAESLASKGFLRAQREYVPPANLDETLNETFKNILGTAELDTKVNNLDERFKLFTACSEKIGHSIPNSLLYQIETLEDVVRFYATPIDTRTPLDKMRSIDLPKNLHVQFEYVRWHPDTDTMFGGVTAFPERSTIVTGLKYKGKYKGHVQKMKHPEL